MTSQPQEDVRQVHVALAERSYDILLAHGLLRRSADWLARLGRVTHVALIWDRNVTPFAEQLIGGFRAAGMRVSELPVPAGETSKSVAEADRLWQALLREGADRKTLVVAVGGGVIGDLAGFVAATFGRGLAFCQVPTTLLAQVDSSVGGKTGINLPTAKNMVGVFHQPSLVLIDTEVLQTLPDREYRSGLAEVVKYGVIQDAEFFTRLEASVETLGARDPRVLADVIARCCQLKAEVVAADERETTGLRAILNYGHTFAHAFESVAGYGTLLHGEAVSIGIVCAARLAQAMGRIDGTATQRQIDLLRRLQLPVVVPASLTDDLLWAAMQHDKKVEHGTLRFVLPTRLGHVELVPGVTREQVVQILALSR